MSDTAALNRFLTGVEQRAFRMARFAVRNTDDALDIVQDSMMTLAHKYATKPESEWAPLFFRILHNRITDWHRRTRVRRSIFGVLTTRDNDGEPIDPRSIAVESRSSEPEFATQMSAAATRLEQAVSELPARQREAFLLRIWEGLDVAATAGAMRCSEGSVKTHLSRALHRLREQLENDWP